MSKWETGTAEAIMVPMAPRLDISEEVRLSFDVPYVTGKGETVDYLTVPVNEYRQSVGISYALLECNERRVQALFPAEGVDSLAYSAERVLHDLGVRPSRLLLQLWEYSPGSRPYSVEGRAPVNRERDTVLIIFTKSPFVYKFGYEMVLWHQAMHAKDRWEHRFPAAHPMVDVGEWLDVLWHFSIDGRLEALGKPHYSRSERLEEAVRVLVGEGAGSDAEGQVRALCQDIWGREVAYSELLGIGERIGLRPVRQA